MPETRACPIWRIWMADYRSAITRARHEMRENDRIFREAGPGNGLG
jgi:hypothetical protein